MTARTEKLSITVPKELASQLRELVPPGEVSAFISEALSQYVRWQKQRQAIEKYAGIWKDEDYPEFKTPEDTQKWLRELRSHDEERTKRLEKQWHDDE